MDSKADEQIHPIVTTPMHLAVIRGLAGCGLHVLRMLAIVVVSVCIVVRSMPMDMKCVEKQKGYKDSNQDGACGLFGVTVQFGH